VSTKAIPQTVASPLIPLPDFVWPDFVCKLSVEQYHEMINAEILTDEDPVELLEGILVTKMPKNPPHSLATQLIRDVLAKLFSSGWCVSAQEPITLADSEPEPDVSVAQGERRQYANRHPIAEDTVLVVEVANSSLSRDRRLKKRIYAKAGIPAYWIVNLAERKIEAYSEPVGADYQQRQDFESDAEIPVLIEGRELGRIAVSELLP
ncbi:MAG: Uma2 family endonuclease, partial [Blastocatellia bacterium]